MVVEVHEAWVGETCFLYVVQRALSSVRSNRGSIFRFDSDFPERCNSKFEMMDVHAVELREANEFGDIPYDLAWARIQEVDASSELVYYHLGIHQCQ